MTMSGAIYLAVILILLSHITKKNQAMHVNEWIQQYLLRDGVKKESELMNGISLHNIL